MSLAEAIEPAAETPFYRERLKPSGASGLAPTTRAELVADQLRHLPYGSRRLPTALPPVRAGITGSGPDLLVMTFTAAHLARERRAGSSLLAALGVAAGMRVANALEGALVTPGSLLLGDVVEEMDCLDVPLGFPASAAAAAQAWTLLDRVQPQILIVDCTGGQRLLTAAPAAERVWLQGIVVLTPFAALTDDGHGLSIPDNVGFSGWQRQWLAVPEATSFLAGSCERGIFHVEEQTHGEVRTPAGSIVPRGKGRLLLTPLGVDNVLLRYDSNLEGELHDGPCACGRSGPILIPPRG